ncbi:MAG: hypothetical protein H5T73_01050 [Actinobacteria bacterium]|nr:hypothetical protein [Actinomycetota bacterium]
MQMLEPDFWKGRGRYSKRAIGRRARNEDPYEPREAGDEVGEEGGDADA